MGQGEVVMRKRFPLPWLGAMFEKKKGRTGQVDLPFSKKTGYITFIYALTRFGCHSRTRRTYYEENIY